MISAPSSYIFVESASPFDRVVERRLVGADVLDEDVHLRVHGERPGRVAGLELLDEADPLLAAEEPDRVAAALERRGDADEVGPLLLLERQVGDVLEVVVLQPQAVPQVAYPSMTAKFVSGKSGAISLTPGENANPTPMTRL